jgi:hypothetical protein
MYYLKPKRGEKEEKEGKEETRPLVLLWGDSHRNDAGMCEECECTEKHSQNKHRSDMACCYPIYSKEFLKAFDPLAEMYPIDFYTEISRESEETAVVNPTNVLFHRFLRETTLACHEKGLRSKKEYEEKCPTRFIRWHYSDPRSMKNTIESSAFARPRQVMMVINHSKLGKDYVQEVNTHVQQIAQTANELEEAALESVYSSLYQSLHTLVGFITSNLEKHIGGQGAELFRKGIVPSLYGPMKTPARYRALFTAYLTYGEGSVVYKQWRKAAGRHGVTSADTMASLFQMLYGKSLKGENDYADQFSPTLCHFIETVFDPDANVRMIPATDSFYTDLTIGEVYQFLYAMEQLPTQLLYLNAFFVELYMLFRMLKPPATSSSPYLAMGFFGDGHTQNLVTLLSRSGVFGDYEVVFRHDHQKGQKGQKGQQGVQERCISITIPIDIGRDITEYAQRVRSQPRYEKTYQAFRNILRKEEAGRNTEKMMAIEMEGGRGPTSLVGSAPKRPGTRSRSRHRPRPRSHRHRSYRRPSHR